MSSFSNAAKEALSDVRDASNELGAAATSARAGLEADLQALREDVAKLAEQIGKILAAKGDRVWQRASTSVDEALSGAQDKGRQAVDAVREVGNNMIDAIEELVKERPYTTLALAVGIGFLFGATWRR